LKSFGENSITKDVVGPPLSLSGIGSIVQDFMNERVVANNKDPFNDGDMARR